MFSGHWNGKITENISLNLDRPVIMAGPCMLESKELGLKVGKFLKDLCLEYGFSYIFKSSYDKANRTSVNTKRGPGVKQGLTWLQEIKDELQVPIVTDVHSPEQALEAAQVADIIQIPAFLCKQRELLAASAQTGRVIQIKKGQWCAPEEMFEIAWFLEKLGNPKVILVERGSCYGYNNLVVDFRNFIELKKHGHAVVFDATHSAQLPSAGEGKSLGLRPMVLPLTKAAQAIGVHGIFMEVHENPSCALSDGETQLTFDLARELLQTLAQAAK